MFWELVRGDVIGKPVELQCPKIVEKASRRAWTEYEHSPRAMQMREYTLKEFWEIFVDDRPFGADAIFRQVNVQSKAVFSCAMTLMDKIRGWEDEERWVGSTFTACMWIYTEEALTRGTSTRPGTRRAPKETHDVHYALHKIGSVLVVSLIMNGCHQGQLSNKRKKF